MKEQQDKKHSAMGSLHPEQETGQPKAAQDSNENSATGANKGNPANYNERDANTGSRPSAHRGLEESGQQGKGDGHGFGGAGMSSSPTFNDGTPGKEGAQPESSGQDKRQWHDLAGQERSETSQDPKQGEAPSAGTPAKED